MTATEFNAARIAAEITTAQLADFMGVCRREMLNIETCRRAPHASEIAALNEMLTMEAA
jgi:DNA-binding XRE family transcriptional regulator